MIDRGEMIPLEFSQQMIANINNGDEFLTKLCMSDEAQFPLTCYANKQK